MAATYGLSHIHLTVADLHRSCRFYGAVIGTEEQFRIGTTLAFLRTPGSRDLIALHAGRSPGVDHFGFQLVRPDDLDEVARAAEASGGTITEHGVHRDSSHVASPFLRVADPDGYDIELLARDVVR